ncbi:phospho-sugar mutase [Candidatus Mycoplasma mahonii]|uniref:phospho-sugar mutase n=1 Tax=Candidatus Mycoplasma mahonii TaxID=3004105 RepID=UPI0026E9D73A|nr:phospho-sugar mutase [Candidatus Mycoplasma mahonii]WKX02599.1 phospho-sugar mutase [Candidatus Mycoplasma mahonii]
MDIKTKIEFWITHASAELVDQIKKMSPKDLEDAFSHQLTFGTAGIRGKIGPGSNNMNIYNIAKFTYGYAKLLKEKYGNQDISVVIGTDNRHKKDEFSEITACVLSSFGIKSYKSLIVPTPFVSFAIRDLRAQGGIIITASHNSANNNGYKIYNDIGAQLLPIDSDKVSKYSEERNEYLTYQFDINTNLISPIPSETFLKYEELVKKIGYKSGPKKIKIIFSPQHGASAKFIPKYLKDLGYVVINVEEQMSHDPDFKGTPSPNPELPEAYGLGIEYAKKNCADIFITTDPDADRIGVVALKGDEYKILNGNQTAAIIFNYIVKNESLDNAYLVYSYVSSPLCKLIADSKGIAAIEVATGFKWISDIIEKFKDKKYIFGFEESFGSLINPNISRDKDSIQAAVLISEIANMAKIENKTLWDLLEDIYKEYMFLNEDTQTKSFFGLGAIEDRIKFMENIRNKADGLFEDEYDIIDLSKGLKYVAPMNLIKFLFKNGSWIAVRPSKTEPKIKFYKIAIAK